MVENHNMQETATSLIPAKEIKPIPIEILQNDTLLLHRRDNTGLMKNFGQFVNIFSKKGPGSMHDYIDMLKKRKSDKLVCFTNLVVGASEKMNAYYADEYMEYDRRPLLKMFLEALMTELGLYDIQPAPFLSPGSGLKHKVLIVSRKGTRQLMNEQKVLEKCQTFERFDCELVQLEKLSLVDQMRKLRETSVLVAVHGNALTNIYWMVPGSVVFQIFPYGAKGHVMWLKTPWYKGENMVHAAELVTGNYLEWEVPLEDSSFKGTNDPNVLNPQKFWQTNFFGAQGKFLLEQNMNMDIGNFTRIMNNALAILEKEEASRAKLDEEMNT